MSSYFRQARGNLRGGPWGVTLMDKNRDEAKLVDDAIRVGHRNPGRILVEARGIEQGRRASSDYSA